MTSGEEKLIAFAKAILSQHDFCGWNAIDDFELQDMMEATGILVSEPYCYEKHGPICGGELEDGDTLLKFAPDVEPLIK